MCVMTIHFVYKPLFILTHTTQQRDGQRRDEEYWQSDPSVVLPDSHHTE